MKTIKYFQEEKLSKWSFKQTYFRKGTMFTIVTKIKVNLI